MIRIAMAAAVLAALVMLAACHSKRSAVPAAQAQDMVITYQKTGGILPFQDSMVVRGSGVIVYTDRMHHMREGFASPADLKLLRSLVSSSDFLQAEPEYRNDRGADLVTHAIDVQGTGADKHVVVMDSTTHPRVLDDLIAELEKLATRTR